ncbi:hypothetical protein M3M38_07295 [Fructilactobacillus cliffordii]|uniref:hypothetical protein n=1 Tax=Fructilactobacillus cliffordii TaxID=2940299 RepID=UPI002092FFCE|nr:hypothetical protein [Fructilactobacillus cliffordii]USS86464.1 hypothetical protein M3M38_07295 [Fructilactobacillus cliffordii]
MADFERLHAQLTTKPVLDFEYNRVPCTITKMHTDGLNGPVSWFLGYALVDSPKFINVDIDDVCVHGGVTFDKPAGNHTHVIGFDCAHYDDYTGMDFAGTSFDQHHWTLDEVKEEAIRMVQSYLDLEAKELSNE